MRTQWWFNGLLAATLSFPLTVTADEAAALDDEKTFAASHDLAAQNPAALTPTVATQRLLAPTAPLRVRWSLPLLDGKVKRLTVAAAERKLPYVLVETDRNDLLAVNADTGFCQWWVTMPRPISGKICIGEKNIYFLLGNRLVALEPVSGGVLWNVELPFAPAAGPTVNEQNADHPYIFIPSFDRQLYCVEVRQEDWAPKTTTPRARRFAVQLDRVRTLWKCPLNGVAASEAVYDAPTNTIYAEASNKEFYGIDFGKDPEAGLDQNKVWTYHTQRGNVAAPVVSGKNILFASEDQTLYALKPTGELNWKYVAGDALRRGPQIVRDAELGRSWLVQKVGGGLVAVHERDGKAAWQHERGQFVVGVTQEKSAKINRRVLAVTLDSDGYLSALRVSAAAPLPETVWQTMQSGATYEQALAKTAQQIAAKEKVSIEEAERLAGREERVAQTASAEGVTAAAALRKVLEAERLDRLLQRNLPAEIAWRLPVDNFAQFAEKSYGNAVSGDSDLGNDYIFCATADLRSVCVLESNR
ncbi:hypothetical protein AGMMS49959_07930 [Planctomycetales bacterium]|nr:hypothetical protein AGMMS49959_07930 [Planctomycetales bacterium]